MNRSQEVIGGRFRIGDNDGYILVSFVSGTRINRKLMLEVITGEIEFGRGSGKDDLWDLRDCSIDPDIYSESLRDVVLLLKRNQVRQDTPGKTAFLVNTATVFGIIRSFQSIAEIKEIGYQIEVFQDEEEALAWLCQSGDHGGEIECRPGKSR